ncbi:hypothetical protein [Sphingomonas morindae]|uniref:Lipoprotein n=1 Tax=Sphingomonas morindae TaxID=1541170 RepID=A0ABY4X4V1_9SPHN|nr:hypothetical protein [Sphingomonas morindae]USI71881.1 hypothetical protein LHA26_11175 [Sphingomonas morindae]
MRRRFALLLLPLVLAACQKKAEDPVIDAAARATSLPCALSGSVTFQTQCTVERMVSGDGLALLIHHPDGGFRRLTVTTDGRGVVTADGAETARVTVIDPGTIQVAIDDDRYRLPATVEGATLPAR